MSKLVASAVLASTLLFAAAPARSQADPSPRLCPGLTVARLEQGFPKPLERFALEPAMLGPLVELWQSGRRPALPMQPESATLYALPGKPLMIGFMSGDCVIALLSVERQRLWQWLRTRLGWPV